METAKILPPTPEEIKTAGKQLYNELVKTEKQPLSTMQGVDEVFAELDKRFDEKFQGNND